MAKTLEPKEAKAHAKAAKKAEKERRRNSNDPADMGRMHQFVEAYKITHQHDKALPWILLGALLLPIVIAVVVGLLIKQVVFLVIFGVLIGIILAMLVLTQRAKRAALKRYEGQAGSAQVALQMLPKRWTSEPGITGNKHGDLIHRTIGPGGLVLIGEGEPGRMRQMLASEAKKHKVTENTPILTVQMGNREGQVPLDQLTRHLTKLPKVLQPFEITEIKSRLRALDAVRPKLPMPKGPMPTSARQARGSRQALRGR